MSINPCMPKFTKKERDHYEREHPTRKYSSPEEEFKEYSSVTKKRCIKCHKEKFICLFKGNTSSSTGFGAQGYRLRRGECIDCGKIDAKTKRLAEKNAKENNLPTKAPEGTECEICGRTDIKIVFDHCHKRCVFRGWLCDTCNRSMGCLGDNTKGLLKSINYLLKNNAKTIIQGENGLLHIEE